MRPSPRRLSELTDCSADRLPPEPPTSPCRAAGVGGGGLQTSRCAAHVPAARPFPARFEPVRRGVSATGAAAAAVPGLSVRSDPPAHPRFRLGGRIGGDCARPTWGCLRGNPVPDTQAVYPTGPAAICAFSWHAAAAMPPKKHGGLGRGSKGGRSQPKRRKSDDDVGAGAPEGDRGVQARVSQERGRVLRAHNCQPPQ